jgi:MSHA biogenesis protein MshN
MSLINKMLQDLDARGTTRADGVPPEIKTVSTTRERMPALRIAAISAGVLVALMGVAAWFVVPIKGKTYDVQPVPPPVPQTAPLPAVTPAPAPVTVAEVAPAPVPAATAAPEEKPVAPVPAPVEQPPPVRPAVEKAAAAPRKAAPPVIVKADPVEPAPAPRVRPTPPAVADAQSAGSTTSWAVASERARAEQDRLARRWKGEEARLAKLPAPQRREGERKLREEQAHAAARAKTEAVWLASLKRKEAAGGNAPNAADAPPPAAPARGQGRVETGSQSAENAYRRALASLQEGRVSEAISSLQAVVRANPRHEAARQTLVSLLIENNRGDEAMTQLQQALTLDPRQPALAMLLARLQIERGKSGIDVLMRTLPYATGNGDYQAFVGGALQRQGRFREAAEQYQTALRTAPGNAVWWMGLGIALQGDKRNAEAADAFRQARALGSLSPELQAFVERRLAQLGR